MNNENEQLWRLPEDYYEGAQKVIYKPENDERNNNKYGEE
jgi:hypothetical protein